MNADPMLGLEIDGYRVLSVIGRGGMGVVYRAENQAGEAIAVKFMSPELAQSPEFRERFMREASSSLDHEHIVPVYGTGELNGLLYLKMYLVHGEDLKVLIRREGKLLPARTIPIFEQAASALDEAHAAAIVHRDVKPQNILIESSAAGEDHVFLSDFGLVKRVAAESSFTGSAHLVGSAQYMSPEQIQGKEIDGRADVYSLGCVAFEALTGQVPYPQEEEVAVLFAHVNDPIPHVTEHTPVLPDSVDHVIEKAMAKSPDDRYLTAGDMVAALAFELGVSSKMARSPWAAGGISTSAVRRREARLKAAGLRSSSAVSDPASVRAMASSKGFLIGVAATLSVLLAFFTLSDKDRRKQFGGFIGAITGATPFAEPSPEDPKTDVASGQDIRPRQRDQQEEPESGIDEGPLSSGRGVPSFASEDGDPTTARSSIVDEERKSETPADINRLVFISTDAAGCTVAHCNGLIGAIDPDGSDHAVLADNPQVDDYDPAWSPGGDYIAYTQGYNLWVMDGDGANGHRISSQPGWYRHAAWSPDGNHLVVSYNPQTGDDPPLAWDIAVMEADGTDMHVFEHPGEDGWPVWSPDGKRIAFTSGRAYPPDGHQTDESDILVMRSDGTRVRRLIATSRTETTPDWSPDGTRIVFSAPGEQTAWELFVKELGSTRPARQITRHGYAERPCWSPHGKAIAFSGTEASPDWAQEIFIVRADGRSGYRTVTDNSTVDFNPDWG